MLQQTCSCALYLAVTVAAVVCRAKPLKETSEKEASHSPCLVLTGLFSGGISCILVQDKLLELDQAKTQPMCNT